MSKIEWTEKTWNPIVGCEIESPGCKNCYAMKIAYRLEGMGLSHYQGLTLESKAGPVWTGNMALAPEHIMHEPLRRKKPTMYFVNSMGDLFHPNVPWAWVDDVWAVMALTPHHTYQILTKHPDMMRAYLADRWGEAPPHDKLWEEITYWRVANAAKRIDPDRYRSGTIGGCHWWPLPNVWLGTSCERQQEANQRVHHLLATPAAIRFVSAEPLLSEIDFANLLYAPGRGLNALTGDNDDMCRPCEPMPRLDWIIVGGESGPKARPMHPDWACSIRDQCRAAGVPYFFKQWGEWVGANQRIGGPPDSHDTPRHDWPNGCTSFRVGKKRAGRLLDGCTWDQMPERVAA